MKLGEMIKEYRKAYKYSMEDFAKKCGMSKAYISILERDYNPVNGKSVVPSLKTIKAVAAAMGQDVNDVFERLDPDQLVDLGIDYFLTPEQQKEYDDAFVEAAKLFYSKMLSRHEATVICDIVVNRLDDKTLKELVSYVQFLNAKNNE